jgi:putative addiction module killer protein
MIRTLEYLTANDHCPYAEWFDELNDNVARKVAISIARMQNGNLSNAKGVGSGVFEYKIDFGPGYRIYFRKDGEKLIILLGGGSKKRQQKDIQEAQDSWKDYKTRKAREE